MSISTARLSEMRKWDAKISSEVDLFVAISNNVARRINGLWTHSVAVIPVDIIDVLHRTLKTIGRL